MPAGLKKLCGVALPATTLTVIYTAPAEIAVSTVVVCNRSATPTTFRLAHAPGGAADAPGHYFAYDAEIDPYSMVPFTIGVCFAPTDVLRAYAGHANLTVTAWGEEQGTSDGGSATFLGLLDTPDAYAGQGGKVVSVKTDVSGLEFTTPTGGPGSSDFLALTDTPDSYTGQANKLVRVNPGASALEFVTPPTAPEQYWSRVPGGSSTILTGLLAYWHLEEATGNRLDAIGTNHLVPTGTTVQVTNGPGKIGSALAMDGTSGTYLSCADNATLSAGPNMSFSLACWVYVLNTGLNHGFMSKGSVAVSTDLVEYMLWQYSGQWRFDVGNGAGTFITAVSSVAPVANQWCLLIAWYDHVADLQYIQVNNGTPVSVANALGSYDSGLPFEVGRTAGFASQSMNGRIDMPMFAKRVWTAQERADLWNNGAGLAHPFTLPGRLSPVTVGDQLLLAGAALTTERLEVDGAIKLGNATGTVDGTIRWSGTDFEGRKGGAWVPLASPTLPLALAQGGTGATTAANARTNLGLGTMAVQDAASVAITGGSATLASLAVPYPGPASIHQVYIPDSGGTSVLGVNSNVSAGAGLRYNIYAQGTAPNFFGGPVVGSRVLLNEGLSTDRRLGISYARGVEHGVVIMPSDDTSGTNAVLFLNAAMTYVGGITTTATATAYNTGSDIRLKHAIAALTGALDAVRALRPVSYRWNVDDSLGHGFLAHELQQVIHDAVSGEPDAVNDDGSIRPQGVDHSKLVPWLVGAVQELLARLEALEAG